MMNKKILTAILLLAFSLCIQLTSYAVSVNGNLTSAFWLREDKLENPKDAQRNLFIYEYLNLYAQNIGSPKISANLSGRANWDKLNDFDKDNSFRLYQGYLDCKPSSELSLRLGRQFLPNEVGFWQMDGVKLETFRSSFASPKFYAGMSALPWTIEGDKEPILGVELGTPIIHSVKGKISFLTLFNRDKDNKINGLDKAILGIQVENFGESIIELLEPSHNRLTIYGKGSVDLLSQKIVNGYAIADVQITSKAQLSLGYQQEEPLFPADSIFSVFDTETFRQLNVDADYQVFKWINLQAQYAREFYDSGPVNRYNAGISITNQLEPLLLIRLERLNDIDTHYWRVYSHIGKQFGKKLEIGFSNYYNNYKLSKSLDNENAYSFQLKTSYQLTRNLQASLRLEDNINPDYKYNIRALGYLRMGFGLGK
jgi:hypothetical protein